MVLNVRLFVFKLTVYTIGFTFFKEAKLYIYKFVLDQKTHPRITFSSFGSHVEYQIWLPIVHNFTTAPVVSANVYI